MSSQSEAPDSGVSPSLSAEVAELLNEAEASPWETVKTRLSASRAGWQTAWSAITAEQADALHDGEWSAREVGSHVAASIQRVTDVLAQLAVAGEAPQSRERTLPGDPDHARVDAALTRAWEHIDMATVTASKISDPGAVIESRLGRLTMKQLVTYTAAHVEQHAEQLQQMPAPTSEGGNDG